MIDQTRRLRTWNRVLVAAVILATGLAAYALLRAPASGSPAASLDDAGVQQLREQIASAGHAQRVRLLHQLARGGGPRAETAIIEALQNAGSDRVRLTAIAQLGRVGGDASVQVLAGVVDAGKLSLQRRAIVALGQIGSDAAVRELVRVTEGADRSLRSHAARALGEAGTAEAVDRLLELAADRSDQAHLAAIAALGATGSERGLTLLAGLVRSGDRSIRSQAVRGLGQAGTDEAKGLLLRLAQGDDRQIQADVVSALASYSGDAVQMVLMSKVNSPDGRVASAALRGLGEVAGEAAQQTLLDAARSGNPARERAALQALAELRTPEARAVLVEKLRTSNNPHAVSWALGSFDDPETRAAVLQTARTGSVRAQQAAVHALSQMKGKDVERTLSTLVSEAPPRVASQALRQLARIQGPAAVPALLEAFREGAAPVRAAALQALSRTGDASKHRKLFLQAARSGNASLEYHAVRALAQLRGPRVEQTLIDLLKDGSPYARRAAAGALSQVGGEQARTALLQAMRDKGDHGLAYAVGQLGDKQTLDTLVQMATDSSLGKQARQGALQALESAGRAEQLLALSASPDHEVSTRALRALGNLGGQQVEATLLTSLSSSDKQVKRAALQGLARLSTPKAVKALASALHDDETFASAASSLARIGSRPAIKALTEHYRSADPRARAAILGQIGTSHNATGRIKQIMLSALSDSSEEVAVAAARALARIGGRRERGQLLAMMQTSTSRKLRYQIAASFRYDQTVYKRHKQLIDQIYNQGS